MRAEGRPGGQGQGGGGGVEGGGRGGGSIRGKGGDGGGGGGGGGGGEGGERIDRQLKILEAFCRVHGGLPHLGKVHSPTAFARAMCGNRRSLNSLNPQHPQRSTLNPQPSTHGNESSLNLIPKP